jgi:NodT family efflux transporter outer membrane factor (OMF) lipoprotein
MMTTSCDEEAGAMGCQPLKAREPLRFGALTATALTALLSACAVGPNFHRPGVAPASGYAPAALPHTTTSTPTAAGAAQTLMVGQAITAQWWTLFRSPALDALIEQAFAHNPSIEAAAAALKQAQENVYAQRGYFFPTVQANYSAERTKLAGNVATANTPIYQPNGTLIQPVAPTQPVTYNFHTAQLTVGYTPDIFGGNRRQVESLRAQADAARFELQAAYVTLTSNVVAAAIQEASTRAQIDAVQAIIVDNEHSLAVLQAQLQLGAVMQLEVSAQQSALAQAHELLPPLQKQLAQTRDLLRVLVGNAPDHDVPQTFTLASLHLPTDLPLSLPSRLITQRPDVRAAEAQVHSASAQVGVALANRLPQFAISGALGGEATQFAQMFSPAGIFWDVIGSVAGTVFDAGTLRHRQRAAEQGLVQAEAQYRGTVLTAFENVADTLHAIYADADALNAAAAAEQAARDTLDLTQKQLQAGYVGYLALLSAQQAYEQASIALVQAQASRFGDTAALFQALGGGWWNHPEPDNGS